MKLLALLAASVILAPFPLRAQLDIQVKARGTSFDIGRNLAWGSSGLGGINNNFIVYSVVPWPTQGVCVYLQNLNSTSSHVATIISFTNGDPNASHVDFKGWFQTNSFGGTIAALPSSGALGTGASLSWYIPLSGAAQFAISISGSTGQAGSPDTANLYAVGSNGTTCPSPAGGAIGTFGTTTASTAIKTTSATVSAFSALNPNTSTAYLLIYSTIGPNYVWCEALPASGHVDASFPVGLSVPGNLNVAPSTTCSSVIAPAVAVSWSIAWQ